MARRADRLAALKAELEAEFKVKTALSPLPALRCPAAGVISQACSACLCTVEACWGHQPACCRSAWFPTRSPSSALLLTQVQVHSVTLDMRDLDAVVQLPAQLPQAFQAVDILINNAGLALGVTTVSDHDIEV